MSIVTVIFARRTARPIVAAMTAMFTAIIATLSHAAPVQYTKICSLYGAGFFYIPGTDTCTSAQQIVQNQYALARLNTKAATGTAMAASLVAPWLPTGTNYAVSNHWAGYDGENAVGFSGLMRLSGHLVFSADRTVTYRDEPMPGSEDGATVEVQSPFVYAHDMEASNTAV